MKKISSRLITGLVIIVIGAAFLLNNIGVLSFGNLFSDWWPMFIVLAGVIIMINNPRSYLWALLVALFGVLLQLNQTGIIGFSPWQLIWPIIIIAIGLSITFGHKGRVAKVVKADRQEVTAILGGSEQKNSSSNFKSSKVTAVMGGAELDLRKAKIDKEATVEVFTFWGGIEIRVPDGVLVKNQVNGILGGIENTTEVPDSTSAPILHIVGDVIMGGVEIKN